MGLLGVDNQRFALTGAVVPFLIGLKMILSIGLFKSDLSAHGLHRAAGVSAYRGRRHHDALLSLRAAYSPPSTLAGILLNLIFVYVVLKTSPWIERQLGKAGEDVLHRVFGVILLTIAIKLFKTNF